MIKLWQASRIITGKSPFEFLDHSRAELDFILEMYAADNPKGGKFIRPGESSLSASEVVAAWTRVLAGKARNAIMGTFTPPKAVLDAVKNRQQMLAPKIQMGPAAPKAEPKK